MNKISSVIFDIIKIIFLPLIILVLFFYLKNFGDILTGLYILFPLCYIFQAVFFKKIYYLIISYIFSTGVFLIFINLWYRIGDDGYAAIGYLILGFITFAVKGLFIRKKKLKQADK